MPSAQSKPLLFPFFFCYFYNNAGGWYLVFSFKKKSDMNIYLQYFWITYKMKKNFQETLLPAWVWEGWTTDPIFLWLELWYRLTRKNAAEKN